MAKYDALADYLGTLRRREEHRLTFAEIERILGFRLPPSARTHPAWWANQSNGRHVQAKAWLTTGWHTTDTDLKLGEVTFRPAHKRPRTAGELVRGLTISQAKKALATQLGIRPQDVEITIRG
jgi:hypothetical protein